MFEPTEFEKQRAEIGISMHEKWKSERRQPMTERRLIIEVLELWFESMGHATAVYHAHSPCCNKQVVANRIAHLLELAKDG